MMEGDWVRCVHGTIYMAERFNIHNGRVYQIQRLWRSPCSHDKCGMHCTLVGYNGHGCPNYFVPIKPSNEELMRQLLEPIEVGEIIKEKELV